MHDHVVRSTASQARSEDALIDCLRATHFAVSVAETKVGNVDALTLGGNDSLTPLSFSSVNSYSIDSENTI